MIIVRLTKIIVFITIFLAICGCQSDDNSTIKTGLKGTLQETLDIALDTNLSDSEAGLTMMVVQNGVIKYQRSKGLANKKNALPINYETGFRLASISKTFTAVATMLLFEQGLLLLDDSILQYLPELSPDWQDITIHHLLSHQSGIPDFANDLNAQKILPNGINNQNILSYFITHSRLEFEPGTNGDYSNTGYVLLAEIINRVSGLTFADYLNQHIFVPMDMQNSYVLDESAFIRQTDALNHANTTDIFGEEFHATGTAGQVSSLEDMHKFLSGLISNDIVAADTLDLMLARHTPSLAGSENSYGYGAFISPTSDVYHHSGGNDGFRTFFVVNPDKNAYIIFLGNGGDSLPDYKYLTELAGQFLE
ncbi:beta-lactamase family protein [Shewanella electrodiphila]|uniref:Beta-lactamase family protein n=1 Tax=Shewanella electrodiphila TaxID=934143 RepID=A0ABT0KM08_9GAMM|nr:serine hydrolase domain-containing protein [Shewanella electrodiphila]MCL1044754.1 beta-lactamase family protein [Shewanella electrodiphila]